MMEWNLSAPAVSQIRIFTSWPLMWKCLIVKSIPMVGTCSFTKASLQSRFQMLVLPTPAFPIRITRIYFTSGCVDIPWIYNFQK